MKNRYLFFSFILVIIYLFLSCNSNNNKIFTGKLYLGTSENVISNNFVPGYFVLYRDTISDLIKIDQIQDWIPPASSDATSAQAKFLLNPMVNSRFSPLGKKYFTGLLDTLFVKDQSGKSTIVFTEENSCYYTDINQNVHELLRDSRNVSPELNGFWLDENNILVSFHDGPCPEYLRSDQSIYANTLAIVTISDSLKVMNKRIIYQRISSGLEVIDVNHDNIVFAQYTYEDGVSHESSLNCIMNSFKEDKMNWYTLTNDYDEILYTEYIKILPCGNIYQVIRRPKENSFEERFYRAPDFHYETQSIYKTKMSSMACLINDEGDKLITFKGNKRRCQLRIYDLKTGKSESLINKIKLKYYVSNYNRYKDEYGENTVDGDVQLLFWTE